MMIGLAIGFVLGGMWITMIDSATIESYRRFNSPWLIHGVGLLTIIFFGAVGILYIKKVFDTKPGLIFKSTGIVDNSSNVSAGLIPWEDISGADTGEYNKQKVLVVHVKNPEKYAFQGNIIRHLIIKINHKIYGSPIIFASTTLKIDLSELTQIFNQYFAEYGSEKS